MASCPRCLTGFLMMRYVDSYPCCLLCGHEVIPIPQDVLDEVRLSHGKANLIGAAAVRKQLDIKAAS